MYVQAISNYKNKRVLFNNFDHAEILVFFSNLNIFLSNTGTKYLGLQFTTI